MRPVTLEPSPFTPLLSLTADFQQKWQPIMLISPGTNPLQTHFVIWLNEWVHIGQVTASAGAHCHREHELVKEWSFKFLDPRLNPDGHGCKRGRIRA
jgi:hypothetical protein